MCSVDNCSNKRYSLGYCKRHYSQFYSHGYTYETRCDERPAIIDGDIALIPLGLCAKDGYAIVDKEDAWVSKHKWSLGSRGYVVTRINRKNVSLHRLVIEASKSDNIDHINCNRLDNKKSNLRIANSSQNQHNKKLQKNNKSGYKGVFYIAKSNKFCAAIGNDGIQKKLGYFNTAIEAAKAYDREAIILHGEFARLNRVSD